MKKRVVNLLLSFSLLMGLTLSAHAVQPTANDVRASFDLSETELLEYVDSFLDRRTEAIITSTKTSLKAEEEIKQLQSADVLEATSLFAAENVAINELHDRREVLYDNDVWYTDYENEITLIDAEFVGNTAILTVEEYTKLDYGQTDEDGPDYTAWRVERVFTFERTDSGWTLISQELLNDNAPAPSNEPTGVSKNTMVTAFARAEQLSEKSESDAAVRMMNEQLTSNTRSGGTYSGEDAADYAIEWWDDRNPDYRSFDADCTNFVSQAMYAGGWTQVEGLYLNASAWWYNALNQSRSWINVSYWHDFANVYSGRTYILNNPKNLYVGDVLQADFENDNSKDHTMIVTDRSSNDVFLTYHSNDTINKSYNELLAAYPDAEWIPHLVYDSFD